MSPALICVVEDDPIMGESLADRFRLEGFDVDWHTNGESAWGALQNRPYQAVISDIRLPDISGEDLFSRSVTARTTVPPFVFITAYASVDTAVSLLKRGAADYITKPFDIGALVEKVRLLTGAGIPDHAMPAQSELGVSDPMRRLAELVPRIAGRARSILVTGESGVGKEVLARFIHRHAPGDMLPFVAVNCGAVPETLLESEFFGHERGAFTGAERQKKGYFEQAEGGTLFLDEIGDLPLLMQVKLLRALQERRITRVGAEREVEANFSLICATNRDLAEQVRLGRFREDLFYRINILQLRVPALRDRPDDVLWLAHRFVRDIAGRLGEPTKLFHPSAEARLATYGWPGNVRELQNRLERACIVCARNMLFSSDIFDEEGAEVLAAPETDTPLDSYMAACENAFLRAALLQHQGRISETAHALGISRKSLWEKMRRHAIAAEPHIDASK
ncbi:two component Fis family sigma54 specific transcriptional regulator [Paraburkholderia sp. BL23I1N1]|uniref:sigma-54-dependent transcriptional regulator n=1 Tax=Paraburkholderia sp. BL23I1N1 TaxID=1938802 RepID=UPI000E70F052|nr:sigma-54 dependent transcriptional regulator [Paraburkholderia sp. BL23I1N1]RKE25240.1 two component Fis family sigma54 specific transcriptional regulator [Paraburkholderia sp. BL23I1N1]